MKTISSHYARLRKALLAALVLVMLPPLLPAGVSHAAGLAEEHTVLYYLIEMQRRLKKSCDGTAMPEAPSLNPSTALRGLAEQSAASDLSPEDFARANGLAGIPFLSASVPAQSAQEAFDRINAAQCSNLMGQDYHYVGAARANGQWTVYLAGAEPGSQPVAPAVSGGLAAPGAPGMGEAKTDPRADSAPSQLLVEPASMEQSPAPEKAEAISPSVSTLTTAAGSDALPAPPYTGGRGGAYDPRPAPSVPVGTVPTDGAGRPLSGPKPVAPSSAAPGPARSVVPNAGPAASPAPTYVPPGGTRGTYDPRPAPSVPVGTVPLDGVGRPLSGPKPLGPSSAAPGAAPSVVPNAGPVGSRAPIYVPPGGAGPVSDPYAPAAPVVTHEFEVRPDGKISGPLRPGTVKSGGASSPTGGRAAPKPSPYAPRPVFPEPQSAAPRPGVLPLNEQGASAYPGGQGVFFSRQTGSTAETQVSGMAATSSESARLLDMVNRARASGQTCGGVFLPAAAPLRANPVITAVAQAHADDMAAKGYFSSTSPQGRTLGQRVSASGYTWAFVAENIASVRPPADSVLQSWMAEGGQCRNLMSSDYADAGVGHNAASDLWVFTLAAPMRDDALRMQ